VDVLSTTYHNSACPWVRRIISAPHVEIQNGDIWLLKIRKDDFWKLLK
jgi:hypothetical protein